MDTTTDRKGTDMFTGPIHRSTFPCYDCDAQPGERHDIRCALTPSRIEDFHIGLTDVWGPYTGDGARDVWAGSEECMWCGEADDEELGTVVQGYHPDCLASANDTDRPLRIDTDPTPTLQTAWVDHVGRIAAPDTMFEEIGPRAYEQMVDENAGTEPHVAEDYTIDEWLVEVWTQYSPFEFSL
jgi:hypothetical protein